jgi:hypothetical protein
MQAVAQGQKLAEHIVFFPAVEIGKKRFDPRGGPGNETGRFFDEEIEVFPQRGVAVLQETIQHAPDEPAAENGKRLVAYIEVHRNKTVIAEFAHEPHRERRFSDQLIADKTDILPVAVVKAFNPFLDYIKILCAAEKSFLHILQWLK